MDYLINAESFWLNYGDYIIVSLIWIAVIGLIWFLYHEKVKAVQDSNNDLGDAVSMHIDREFSLKAQLHEATKAKIMIDEAWSALKSENLKLKRENYLLREKISKKQEFRLRNGHWCTEEQYLAEKNGLTLSEQLNIVDANEEANKQIDSFLNK